jgi:hypothetical protein
MDLVGARAAGGETRATPMPVLWSANNSRFIPPAPSSRDSRTTDLSDQSRINRAIGKLQKLSKTFAHYLDFRLNTRAGFIDC